MAKDQVQRYEGQQVTAYTYPDADRELPPRQVQGVLTTRKVETWGNVQCFVGGVLVDPSTVVPGGRESLMDAQLFGVRLKELREGAGLSQKELAARAGLGQRSVSNWEQGIREPVWSNVVALAAALGVDCRAFLEEPGEISKPGRGRPPARTGKGEGPKLKRVKKPQGWKRKEK
jgi:transcriptional regulator with XRE-family HTH domain